MELEFYGKNRRNERINTKKRRNHRSDKPNKWRPIEIDRLNGKETTNQMDCEWSIYDGKMRYFSTMLIESELSELLELIYKNADWKRNMMEIIKEATINWSKNKDRNNIDYRTINWVYWIKIISKSKLTNIYCSYTTWWTP